MVKYNYTPYSNETPVKPDVGEKLVRLVEFCYHNSSDIDECLVRFEEGLKELDVTNDELITFLGLNVFAAVRIFHTYNFDNKPKVKNTGFNIYQ